MSSEIILDIVLAGIIVCVYSVILFVAYLKDQEKS